MLTPREGEPPYEVRHYCIAELLTDFERRTGAVPEMTDRRLRELGLTSESFRSPRNVTGTR